MGVENHTPLPELNETAVARVEPAEATESLPSGEMPKVMDRFRTFGENVIAVAAATIAIGLAARALRVANIEMGLSFLEARALQQKISNDLKDGKTTPAQAAIDRQKVSKAAKDGQKSS